MGAVSGRLDFGWLMRKVCVGAVGIGTDWLYYVRVNADAEPILCDDEVHALEDAGWVWLEPDGPVSPTKAWRRRCDAQTRARAADRARTGLLAGAGRAA